ncbi:MAG: hypothetical protein R3F62_24715 [Planctomycetota bacterium]
MADSRERARERDAQSGDEGARLALGRSLWRSGQHAEAVEALQIGSRRHGSATGELLVELLGQLAPEQRRAFAQPLSVIARHHDVALALLVESLPSLARLEGPEDELRRLQRWICRNALHQRPLRLLGMRNPVQAAVAACVHDLRQRPGFCLRQNVVAPGLEAHYLELALAEGRWATVCLYELSHSHYERLLERARAACAAHGAKLILGARKDAWDGARFGVFDGPEVTLEEVGVAREPGPLELFEDLLYENAREEPELPEDLRRQIARQGRGAEFLPLLHAAQRTIQVGRDEGRSWADAVRIGLARWL